MPPLKLPFFISSICPKTHPQNLNQFLRTTAAQPPPARRPGWRIAPCAPLAHFLPVAHDKAPLVIWKLGFRQFGGLRSSSEYRGGVLGGESGGSGILADMGSENNNNKDEQWLDNDCSPDSALPPHNHRQDHRKKTAVAPPQPPHHQSTKLLTLPTILTIGRVAAVPLLVCSTFWFLFGKFKFYVKNQFLVLGG